NILVCPPTWQPVFRVLILHERHEAVNPFLDAAARLCEAIHATPVVLTVARSQTEARVRERLVKEVLAPRRFEADFDFVAGLDTRTAVLSVARWRRCSHVFMERRQASSWWRWLRGDTIESFFGLSNSLAFLSIPSTGLPILDRK